jgi:DNA polymerase III delta subunit
MHATPQSITILHGDNTVASRNELAKIREEAKNKQSTILTISTKKITPAELELVLGETDLFGTKKTLIIEELHSLPKSKKKTELITLLSQPSPHNLILWEKRLLTKTMLKQFAGATAIEFKMSNVLFNWLDAFGRQDQKNKALSLLQEAVKKDGEYLCFIMLIRHIRLLLLAKTGGTIKGPPFMVSKYISQARGISEEQLLDLHTKLTQIDERTKTSTSSLKLESQLDLLTLGVYI